MEVSTSPYELQHAADQKRRRAARIVWAIALLMIAGATLSGYSSIDSAESAPQQAAAAAMHVFYAVTPYMLARGIDAMLR